MSLNKIIVLAFVGISFLSSASEKNNQSEKLAFVQTEWETNQFPNYQLEELAQSRQERLTQGKITPNKPKINIKDLSISRSSLFVISSSKL